MSHCCVFGCSNSYKKAAQQRKDVHFYNFPKYWWMQERRKIWIRFAKRVNNNGKPWEPSKRSVICSDHFVGGTKSEDPNNPSYNPTIFNVNHHHNQTKSKVDRYQRIVKRALMLRNGVEEVAVDQNLSNEQAAQNLCQSPDPNSLSENDTHFKEVDTQTSPCHTVSREQQTETEAYDKRCGPDNRLVYFGGFSALKTKQSIRELTGISNNVFSVLLSLFPNAQPTVREFKLEDKLLLTLFKLKSGLTFAAIGSLFGIAGKSAARIFDTTLEHLAAVTRDWIFVPSQEATRATLPLAFRGDYDSCRMILDCTEMRTETPDSVDARIHMYSNYKSGYTAKYLIGVAPNGFISFLSKGYGGRATDSYITNDCGVLDALEEGDLVLADKGFPNVHVKDGCVLVMPPFAKRNEPQFSSVQMEETYRVARVRIHVERVIQRLKTFEILVKRIPTEILHRLDDIMHVCSVLVNLSSPIIKENQNS